MGQTNSNFLKFCVGRFAKGSEGGLQMLWLDRASGELKAGRCFGDGQVFYCASDAEDAFLYSVRASSFNQGPEAEELLVWEPESGGDALQLVGRQVTRGRGSCYLGIVPQGGPVLLAHYGASVLSAIARPVSDELAGAADSWDVVLDGGSVHPERQRQAHPHSFIGTPLKGTNDAALYAADLGSDRVWCFRYDRDDNSIAAAEPAYQSLPPGSGPRHLALHPGGAWLYCLNELSNTLSVLRRDPETGAIRYQSELQTVPDSFEGESFAGDLASTPDGRFLYATNRGHDSIVGFDLAELESPRQMFHLPSGAPGPQNLALSADGQWLLCAHLSGNRVVAFAISQDDGSLSQCGPGVELSAPACICELFNERP